MNIPDFEQSVNPSSDDYTQPEPVVTPIQVLSIKPNPRPGNVRAFAVVAVKPFEINGLKIVQQPGQRAYVAWPQVESAGKFYPLLKCNDEQLKNAVAVAVLAAWNGGVE